MITLLLTTILTIRTGLTSPIHHIDGNQANKPIAVLVTPNVYMYNSDEIEINQGHKTFPVSVYRTRFIKGVEHICKVDVFHVEFLNIPPTPQVFIIQGSNVKEFDTFMFEGRPWYSINTSISNPVNGNLLPLDVDKLSNVFIPFPTNGVFDCE